MSQEGGSSAGSLSAPLPPKQAVVPAEFTAALRALRVWSGLTYRQLEEKTATQQVLPPLPASTIATTLGRATLPKEQFVDAFTRACGLGDDDVRQWLEARRRIAVKASEQTGVESDDGRTGDQTPDSEASFPSRPPRWRRAVSLLAALAVGVAGTLGVHALVDTSAAPPSLSALPITGLAIRAVGSWTLIHPARTPQLCLTEGRDRTGRYATAVVAQKPCTQAALPHVFVEPIGQDTVQIQWHHPEYGIGCLTVLLDGPGRDLLEPRDDCADDNPAQRFRIEPFGPEAAAHFRIRPVGTDQCLSLRDQDTAADTEVVQGRCSSAPDQEFLIELIASP